MRISDWSSDVCSSDLLAPFPLARGNVEHRRHARLTCAVQHALLIFHQPLIVQMAMAIDQHQPALSGSSSRGKTGWRSEEHTSELQSLMRISYAVFCLKKKKNKLNFQKKEQKLYNNIYT